MAPWMRADNQLVDLEDSVAYELIDGFRDENESKWNTPPSILITYKNMSHRQVRFDTLEEASQIFEMLFKLVMPDAAEQLENYRWK